MQEQDTNVTGASLQELTTGERLVRAILGHRVVELAYDGFSHSGEIPGWRTFITKVSERWM